MKRVRAFALATLIGLLSGGSVIAAAPSSNLVGPVTAGGRGLCREATDPNINGNGGDAVRVGVNGWLFRYGPDYQAKPTLSASQARYMAELTAALKRRSVQLVMIVPAPRILLSAKYLDTSDPLLESYNSLHAASGYAVTLSRLRQGGAIVPNLLPSGSYIDRVRDLTALYGEDFYFSHDFHWSTVGARVSAEMVAYSLRNNPIFKSLRRTAFVTKFKANEPVQMLLQGRAAQACGYAGKPDTVKIFETVPSAQGSGGGLLGSSEVGIVLIGTSFSDWRVPNFHGFLQEALETEVVNYSIKGGGHSASILSYLSSADFLVSPPKLLLWEFLSYDLPTEDTFRKVLGTLDGDCKASPIANIKFNLQPGSSLVAQKADGYQRGARIYLTTTSASLRRFDLVLRYRDGSEERVEFDASRGDRTITSMGIRLPKENAPLAAVTMIPMQKVQGTAELRICRG